MHGDSFKRIEMHDINCEQKIPIECLAPIWSISLSPGTIAWDYTHDRLANNVSLKITNHKIDPPKYVHTRNWISCERHALVNDDIGKVSNNLNFGIKDMKWTLMTFSYN